MTHAPLKSELEGLHQEKKALITILKKAYTIIKKQPELREFGIDLINLIDNVKGQGKEWIKLN